MFIFILINFYIKLYIGFLLMFENEIILETNDIKWFIKVLLKPVYKSSTQYPL